MKQLNVRAVEKTIRIPAEKWRGRCHEIAALLLKHKLVRGKLRYGHWTGIVMKGSRLDYYPNGLVRHGWVELADGTIVDPTRFDFEQKPPYIYVGKNDYYDAGGNLERLSTLSPAPKFDPQDKLLLLQISDNPTASFLISNLQRPIRNHQLVITIHQAFWLANLPLQILGKNAKQIYKSLIAAGQEGLIPIDNNQMILGA